MLESLLIQQFQCHKKIRIEFDPQITCFLGRSDSGKSAILRSIRWICSNRPSGVSFLRRYAVGDETDRDAGSTVKAFLRVDAHTITRRRGKGGNVYVLDGRELRSFNAAVPEEIARILNIGAVNFQKQHDSPFLLTLSPGETSRSLNTIINLGEIDRTLASLASRVRKARSVVEVTRERYREAKKVREGLAWTVEAGKEWKRVQNTYTTVQKNRQDTLELTAILQEVREVSQRVDRLSQGKPALLLAVQRGKETILLRGRIEVLGNLLHNIGKTRSRITELKGKQGAVRTRIGKFLKGRCPICQRPLRKEPCHE